ncbi:hypothetical protein [Corynebacterium doosanense]|uniref:Uncharacterized protein n=1 Tax=Corynebacterium doosanense CAU 212 = DSM 45436 TaxID=558173 RepID=A0A097ICW5_9CORY|nr:hypothetical protein [Corynebacterium doosanense]AIT59964.1 hypothetical protein CDOO_00485 [Corynebacterium doosanense CAU 212 = DSM 45436]
MTRSRFGRPRFGGSTGILLALSALTGLVLGAGVAWLIATLADLPAEWMLIYAAFIVPVLCALAWAFMVDRDTIAGATRSPEDSIETDWLHRASAGALTDTFAAIGLALLALTILGDRVSVSAENALLAVFAVGFIDVAARYLVLKRKFS